MTRFGVAIAAIALLLIQVTQQVLFATIAGAKASVVVTPFFNLVTVWNPGISFGMLQDISNGQWILSAVAMLIVAWLFVWLRKVEHRSTALALGLIIGGAIGNIIDRIRFSAVFDYLDFHAFGYHWPAFNLSDSFIFIGVALLLFSALGEAKTSSLQQPTN
ncbi:MAG: signal peptidase II [Alphaproteobacteria bacterium]|nr:signal peptidase II [Alphaproteobacteria bacterium]|tara:strand:+ start:192 stop:674 length:483 start_codon:yes stop_codon:yes gene_type:complete